MIQPDFLAIGHVTRDLLDRGWTLGGSVTFSSSTAVAMGRDVATVTRARLDDLVLHHSGLRHVIPDEHTTTFRNDYSSAGRRQTVSSVAGPLGKDDVPVSWRSAQVVHLGPVAGELPLDFGLLFPDSLVVATAQGWLRTWCRDGLIRRKKWPAETKVEGARVVVLSIDDLGGDESAAAGPATDVELFVLTRGKAGATLVWDGSEHHIAAYPARELDPTGAGDVFAAAFAIRLDETDDPLEAADFAAAAAAISVESVGTRGLPGHALVAARRKAGR